MAHIGYDKHRFALISGILLGGLMIGTALVAHAHQTPPAPGAKNTTPSVSVGATSPPTHPLPELWFKGPWRNDSKSDVTVGNLFVYTRDDSKTTGDHGRFKMVDKKTNSGILDADGNLVFDDTQHHATCNKAHVDMITKVATFTESVVLVLKPETGTADTTAGQASQAAAVVQTDDGASSGARSEKKHGVTVYCDRMEDQYKKKYIKLFGHLTFKQKYADANGKTVERVLTAEHAEYNGKSDVMILFGPVDGHDGNGQEVHSTKDVKIGTKEGEESLEGSDLKLKFLPQEDNEADAEPDANGKATQVAGVNGGGAKDSAPKEAGTKEAGTKGKQ